MPRERRKLHVMDIRDMAELRKLDGEETTILINLSPSFDWHSVLCPARIFSPSDSYHFGYITKYKYSGFMEGKIYFNI